MLDKMSLNGQWQWKSEKESTYHKGQVPGTVLDDMLKAELIENPYWRLNEYPTKQRFYEDYTYRYSFEADQNILSAESLILVFEGIDTLSKVSLNHQHVLSTEDMHRTYRIDVKALLKSENVIEVTLKSPLAFIEEEDAKSDIFYASTGCMKGNGKLRKAHYMFGWDWGPQIPDAGIFRDVYLEYGDKVRMEDVRIRQFHEEGHVRVEASVQVPGDYLEGYEVQVKLCGRDGEIYSSKNQKREESQEIEESRESQESQVIKTSLEVENPHLWWPNGYGDPYLYSLQVNLVKNQKIIDTYVCNLGLRTFTVCTDEDQWGNQFAFVINGQKIFAMGANYIPEDNIIARVNKEKTEELIRSCVKANFNCLRVWGGGYYPSDFFYDLCDRYGLIIWQDLMFACNVYDLTPDFEENILAETIDNVKRIRHHACLGLWCGNNEMEWGWKDWGRLEGHRPKYKADYIKIFEMLLPRTVMAHDDQTYYWLSSPSSGGSFDEPNDFDRGDNHYWEVWHSNKPFTEYRDFHFRFCSEFGFQSFPGEKTLESFCKPEDMNIFSEVMEAHQKNGMANSKIFSYIADYYKYPKDMVNIAYISQILQLKAIEYGVGHWRRNWGRCMGAIYWQLNDCWPVASWSSIDYYGRWKALHYGAKRFYQRLMASACEREELSTQVDYYVHNESFEPQKLILRVRLIDHALEEKWAKEIEVTIGAFEVMNALQVDFSPLLDREDKKKSLAVFELLKEDEIISSGSTFFVKPKYFDYLQAQYKVKITDEGLIYRLHIESDVYTNYLELDFKQIDVIFSDNYMDITRKEGVDITINKEEIQGNYGLGDLEDQLKLRSIAESF